MAGSSRGLRVSKVQQALSCCRSYVYKLVKQNQLSVIVGSRPMLIETDSIIDKIANTYPFLVEKCEQIIRSQLEKLETQNF